MRFPPSFLDEIRARIPISDVIGRRVAWDKRKSNPGRGDFWACCPFHGEKTPSFHAENRKGRYHCFGCGVSGDHFTFLVEQEGLSFPEAVEQLAQEAGLPLPDRDPEAEKREATRASLYDVMELAARFFEEQLQGPDGGKARAYIRGRGILPDVQKRFRLGYAPASRNALKQYLAEKNVGQEQMVEAGLLIAGDDIPVSYDRFRDRVIFPIADLRGRVIAFGGRALSSDVQAKYLNSPETPLFHKSHVLYNGQAARAASRKGGHVVVVEGYIDVIACVAAGFEATVAPLGTALTEDHLRLLWQMTEEPVLCFDGDEAGLRAADRTVQLAKQHFKPERSIRIASLPPGQDPDDFIQKNGASAFESVLERAQPVSRFVLSREVQGVDLTTPEHRAALEKRLYDFAFSIEDKAIARHYRDYFRLHLSELFWGSDKKRRNAPSGPFTTARGLPENTVEKIIVGICVEAPALFREQAETVIRLDYVDMRYVAFFSALERLLSAEISVRDVYRELGEEFYQVLRETHGTPILRAGLPPEPSRGEQLRLIFPAIRVQPSLGELAQTLAHFILLHRYKRHKAELEAMIGLEADDEVWLARIKGLDEFRMLVEHSERELDAAYQRRRFRPANDNFDIGNKVLSGDPNWKSALRR